MKKDPSFSIYLIDQKSGQIFYSDHRLSELKSDRCYGASKKLFAAMNNHSKAIETKGKPGLRASRTLDTAIRNFFVGSKETQQYVPDIQANNGGMIVAVSLKDNKDATFEVSYSSMTLLDPDDTEELELFIDDVINADLQSLRDGSVTIH